MKCGCLKPEPGGQWMHEGASFMSPCHPVSDMNRAASIKCFLMPDVYSATQEYQTGLSLKEQTMPTMCSLDVLSVSVSQASRLLPENTQSSRFALVIVSIRDVVI